MDIWYFVGLLILPIVISIVAVVMRLLKRNRPLIIKHYLIIYIIYVLMLSLNTLIPWSEKLIAFLLAAIILGVGYLIDSKLKENKAP